MSAMAMKRKTFSGAGKPKSLVPYREPNGREQRPPKGESIAQIVSIAEAQPHRRKSESPRSVDLATPIGRLLHARKMLADNRKGARSPEAANFLDAARRYGDAFAGERWASASRRPWANVGWKPEKVFDSPEAEAAYTADLERKWLEVKGAVGKSPDGDRCLKALEALILDSQQEDWQPPHWVVFYGEQGLWVLVKFFQIGR